MNMIRHKADLPNIPVRGVGAFDKGFKGNADCVVRDKHFAAVMAAHGYEIEHTLAVRYPNGNSLQVLPVWRFIFHIVSRL